jgi:NADH:ubiquinone oxidoreductase subunit H
LLLVIGIWVSYLLAVAFLTLTERKLLSLSQSRLGPNKSSVFGLLQPVLDGVKLFLKSRTSLEQVHKLIYFISSYLTLSVMLLLMMALPFRENRIFEYQGLWLLVVLGLGTHLILICG